MANQEVWVTGNCKNCNSIVIEAGDGEYCPELAHEGADYQNSCTNKGCINYGWHYMGDQDELEYIDYSSSADLQAKMEMSEADQQALRALAKSITKAN